MNPCPCCGRDQMSTAIHPTDAILAKIDIAHQALLEAKTIQEVKKIADIAQAAKIYAQRQKLGSEAIQYAHSLVTDAERRLGEMIRQQKETVGLATGRDAMIARYPKGTEVPRPTLAEAGIGKKVSARAQSLARMPEDIFEKVRSGEMKIPQAKKELRRREAPDAPPTPDGKYRVLYADPPWEYGNEQPAYHTEQAEYYPLMSIDAIAALPIREITDDNAVLFLWVTSPILKESFQVIDAWGFEYKTSFVWDKVKHNMGHYNSVRHEFLLVCTKGSCTPDVQKLFDSVQTIERTKHSEKPEKFRKIIDTIYPHGKRIELFSRKQSEGWESFGNELPRL